MILRFLVLAVIELRKEDRNLIASIIYFGLIMSGGAYFAKVVSRKTR